MKRDHRNLSGVIASVACILICGCELLPFGMRQIPTRDYFGVVSEEKANETSMCVLRFNDGSSARMVSWPREDFAYRSFVEHVGRPVRIRGMLKQKSLTQKDEHRVTQMIGQTGSDGGPFWRTYSISVKAIHDQ